MNRIFSSLFVAAVLGSSVFTIGCSHEVSHTSKDTPTWTGGEKHEETTTYKNPDGTLSTEKSSSTTH